MPYRVQLAVCQSTFLGTSLAIFDLAASHAGQNKNGVVAV